MSGSSGTLVVAAALACGLLAQVPGATYEVSGVVYDARTSLPLEGATAMASGPSATSDRRGAFRVRVDGAGPAPSLSVRKSGYVTGIVRNLRPGINNLRIDLNPSPEITGRVVDSETGEPVEDISILLSPRFLSGVNNLSGMRSDGEKTGEDGRFALSMDPSWSSLLVIVRPPLWTENAWMVSRPSEEDRKTVDQDYEPLYWPGEGNPLNVAAGASMDAGVLRLRKTSYYRANISFPASSCREGVNYQAALFQMGGESYPRPIDLGRVKCGQGFTVRGLAPGSYRIELTKQEATPLDRHWALIDFAIVNENVNLEASFTTGIDIQGRVVAAAGARLPERLTVSLTELDTRLYSDRTELAPSVNANFHLPNVVLGLKHVLVRDLPPGYVADVRFRGAALPGNVVRWDGSGSLEVVVDDRAASITGRVTEGQEPAGFALVFIVPWPKPPALREGEHELGEYQVRVDTHGEFTRQDLNAGEYRIFAIPAEQAARVLDPAVQQRLVQQAERITLLRGGAQTLVLPLLDPTR